MSIGHTMSCITTLKDNLLKMQLFTEPVTLDVCNPSPCGPFSRCQQADGRASCTCLPDYRGTPPFCMPPLNACVNSASCGPRLTCINQRCVDPCVNSCGRSATCNVVNRSPVCSCTTGFGDPLITCLPRPAANVTIEANPCVPSPCGPLSQCRQTSGYASCACEENALGLPPNCRFECVQSSECQNNLACVRNRCVDPCPGTCGVGATCSVVRHVPICVCPEGMTGDPSYFCSPLPPQRKQFLLFPYLRN